MYVDIPSEINSSDTKSIRSNFLSVLQIFNIYDINKNIKAKARASPLHVLTIERIAGEVYRIKAKIFFVGNFLNAMYDNTNQVAKLQNLTINNVNKGLSLNSLEIKNRQIWYWRIVN